MPWKISIVRLPLPNAPLAELMAKEPKETAKRECATEAEALIHCRELVKAGYGVDVTGPNDVYWDKEEVLRRLNSGAINDKISL